MVRNCKITYIFSGFLLLASLTVLLLWGFKPSIDFTGGSLLEAEYKDGRPEMEKIQKAIASLDLGSIVLQPAGEKDIIIRLRDITENEHQKLFGVLSIEEKTPNEKRFDSIGPVIGKELRQKSWMGIFLVVLMIVLYITWAFRKVSRPVSSWKYGIATIIALLHDVAIPSGVFAVLGHFKGVEVDVLFITALLTTLGFSVHDTIVVFDRIRENLRKQVGKTFEETVEYSIRQTIVRSINTSMTVIFVLVAIFIFGGQSTKYFSLALLIGVTFGTYSSICLASPILVTWNNFKEKRNKKR